MFIYCFVTSEIGTEYTSVPIHKLVLNIEKDNVGIRIKISLLLLESTKHITEDGP